MIVYRIIISAIWWVFGLVIIGTFGLMSLNQANFGLHTNEALDWISPN